MRRSLTIVLMLTLISGGLEAATDIGAVQSGDPNVAHEMHGDFHDDGPALPDEEGKHVQHFCHCTAHAPAVSMSIPVPSFRATLATASTVNRLRGTQRPPPLLQPPNRG